MFLNLGQNEYLNSVTDSAGAVIVVHEQIRMPFPEDEGVYAPPGHLTSIGTRRVNVLLCITKLISRTLKCFK